MKNLYKDFKSELSIITQIESFNSKPIRLGGEKKHASLTKTGKKFQLYFKGLFPYPENGELEIGTDDASYRIMSSDFEHASDNPMADIPGEHHIDIDAIRKGNIRDNVFFRMFFFDDSDRSHIFSQKLQSPRHDGKVPWAFDCVRLSVNGKRYDITQHQYEKMRYIIIENLDGISYGCFTQDAYAIQRGIGFLVGYMPGGEHYIFSGENFEYARLSRNSLKSPYHPVTANPYSFLALHKEVALAKDYEAKLKVIPATVVSDFITQIRNSEEFGVAILFMLEAMSLKSAVSMPGVFSVILESLATLIIRPEKVSVRPIPDQNTAEELVDELHARAAKFASKLTPDAAAKIGRRISAINQPLNPRRLTNSEKLREPFDQLGIKLSQRDEKAIAYRNYLLHGNIMMNESDSPRSGKEIDDHMLYVSARLYTLISKLILSNSGFDGYVVNHARLYDLGSSSEAYFEEI